MSGPFPSPTHQWHTTTYDAISPLRPELFAKGKTVIITGGGTGIGAETARSFAAAGASRIALLGRREQPLLDTKASIESQSRGVEVFVAPTDLTKEKEVHSAFDKFLKDKKVDILVSNAAMNGAPGAGSTGSVQDTTSSTFLEIVNQNLSGSLFVAQAFLQHAAPDAVVIDVSSNAIHLPLGGAFSAYVVAKWAVIKLWESLGEGHSEMRVFHVHPGVVDTAMNREVGGIAMMGGYEDHGMYQVRLDLSSLVLTPVSLSPGQFSCVAEFQGACVPQRKVSMG